MERRIDHVSSLVFCLFPCHKNPAKASFEANHKANQYHDGDFIPDKTY